MDTYLKQTPEFDLSFEPDQNALIVLSNIQFIWLNAPFTSFWNEMEKNQIVSRITKSIWGNWNNVISLTSNGKSLFSKKKSQQNIPVVFSTQQTNSKPHWTIEVSKTQEGGSLPSYIQWSLRKIFFSIEDTTQQTQNRSHSGMDTNDSYWGMHSHEFSNAHALNSLSVGNICIQLREKYLSLLLVTVNDPKASLLPKTEFTINSY